MTSTQQKKLTQSYRKYRTKKNNKQTVLESLRVSMPEMIFRTTRLEGERVTRRMIAALFK